MERGLVLRQHFFGSDSEEVWSACKIVGEMCNLLAMTYLQQEDFGMVLELLKKAEILTERDEAGRAVTYNNLACYYRRRGKLHAALQYLHKALKIEAKMVRPIILHYFCPKLGCGSLSLPSHPPCFLPRLFSNCMNSNRGTEARTLDAAAVQQQLAVFLPFDKNKKHS